MKRLPIFAAICACIMIAGYAAFSAMNPSFRYELELDVEVDGVTHSGSGIVEISYDLSPKPAEIDGYVDRGRMRGYAITIDLGNRGLLFVVDYPSDLQDPSSHKLLFPELTSLRTLPFKTYGFLFSGPAYDRKTALREIQGKRGWADVSFDHLPMLLHYRDINDPSSFEEVNPRDLATAFGPGVRLVRARMRVTEDAVTPMPASWPAWLREYNYQVAERRNDGHRMKLVSVPARIFKGEQ